MEEQIINRVSASNLITFDLEELYSPGERVLFEPLRARVAERVFRPFAGCYEIVPAALGEEVVVHGALALARRHLS